MNEWSYYITRLTPVGAAVATGEEVGFSGRVSLMDGEWKGRYRLRAFITSELPAINSKVVRAEQGKVEIRL